MRLYPLIFVGLTTLSLLGCQKTASTPPKDNANNTLETTPEKKPKLFVYSVQAQGAAECLHQAQKKWPTRMLYSLEESYSMNEKDTEPKRGQLMSCTLVLQNPDHPNSALSVSLDPYTGEFREARSNNTPRIPSKAPSNFKWQDNLIELNKINVNAIKLKVESEYKNTGAAQYEDLGLAILSIYGYGGAPQSSKGFIVLSFSGRLKSNLVQKDRIMYMSTNGLQSQLKP